MVNTCRMKFINSIMFKAFLFSISIFISVLLSAQNPGYDLSTSTIVRYEQLKKEFASPPPESRLRCYWWWLNSMATKQSITRDLEEMKAKGLWRSIDC